jgi:TusA-related sulfurtransferase
MNNCEPIHCDLDQDGDKCPQAIAAADHAVKKVFAILGVDVDKPESVEVFREDLRFGKKLRRASDHGQLVMVAAFVGGMAYAIWGGIQAAFRGQ